MSSDKLWQSYNISKDYWLVMRVKGTINGKMYKILLALTVVMLMYMYFAMRQHHFMQKASILALYEFSKLKERRLLVRVNSSSCADRNPYMFNL